MDMVVSLEVQQVCSPGLLMKGRAVGVKKALLVDEAGDAYMYESTTAHLLTYQGFVIPLVCL